MDGFLDTLPFARQYLKETWFEGSLQTLWIPNKLTLQPYPLPEGVLQSEDQRSVNVVAGNCSVEEEKIHASAHISDWGLPCTLYFEVEIRGSDLSMRIGFNAAGQGEQICYHNGGMIIWGGNQQLQMDSYDSGDTIGCGFLWPGGTAVFTKNGEHIAQITGLHLWNYVQPEIVFTPSPHSNMTVEANFGQRPFRYDIEAHCASINARSREIAATLPPEIFEEILEQALLLFDKELDGGNERRYWVQPKRNYLTQVCRRWRTVCHRHILSCLWLESPEDLDHIVDMALPITCNALGVDSRGDKPWAHCFLLSPVPVSLKFNKWDCTQIDAKMWDRLPPAFSTRVPALMHSAGLVNIQELRLEYWSFPSWLRMAQLVFAFLHLRTFIVDSVHFGAEATPLTVVPSWLRYRRRLSRWTANTYDTQKPLNFNYHFLLLFVCARPRCSLREQDFTSYGLTLSREDVGIILSLAQTICGFSRFLELEYSESRDPQKPGIVIAGTGQDDRQLLRLEFQPHGSYHQLVAITTAWDLQTTGSYAETLQRLLSRLSSSDSCKCRFDLSKVDIAGQIEDRQLESALSLNRHITEGMAERRAAKLIDFKYNGEVMKDEDGADLEPGVRWMAEYPAKFTFVSPRNGVLLVGTRSVITWDTKNVLPGIKGIPWVKLYTRTAGAFGPGKFVVDVECDINMAEGLLEFTVPSVPSGHYFLLLGDYVYRTPDFNVARG